MMDSNFPASPQVLWITGNTPDPHEAGKQTSHPPGGSQHAAAELAGNRYTRPVHHLPRRAPPESASLQETGSTAQTVTWAGRCSDLKLGFFPISVVISFSRPLTSTSDPPDEFGGCFMLLLQNGVFAPIMQRTPSLQTM